MKTLLLVISFLSVTATIAQTNYGVKFKVTAPDGFTDETIVRLKSDAQDEFDGAYDAWKWFTWNNDVPSVFSTTSNDEALAINTHDFMSKDTSMFIWMRAMNTGGVFTMETEQLGDFPPNIKLALRDLENNNIYILDQNRTFNFDVTISPDDFQRFELFYSTRAIADTVETNVTISNLGNNDWTYQLEDSIGTVISNGPSTSESVEIEDLEPGDYAVYVTDSFGLMDTVYFQINVTEPPIIDEEEEDVVVGEQADRGQNFKNITNEESAGLINDYALQSGTVSIEYGVKYLNYQSNDDQLVSLNIYNYSGQLVLSNSIASTEIQHFEIPSSIVNGIAVIVESTEQTVIKF